VVYVAPDASDRLQAVRSSWVTEPAAVGSSSGPDLIRPSAHEGPFTEVAASAWNGMLVARILGPDGASVRGKVIAALTVLREARPLPRVWLC
jgi:hypothetical protein